MTGLTHELIIPRDRQDYPSLFSTLGTAGWEKLTSSECICMYESDIRCRAEHRKRIINRSFLLYTEVPSYPDKGPNHHRAMKSLDSELFRADVDSGFQT
jgi:hypothetical protein